MQKLEESVLRMVTEICSDEHIVLDFPIAGVRNPSDFVESWRIVLWEKAFMPFFAPKDKKAYTKKSTFSDFPGAKLAVKRVVYRCVIYSNFYQISSTLYIFLLA
jgi:hypothetical protein